MKPVWARMTVSVPWQAGIGAALLIQAATAGCLKIFSTFPKDFPYADRFFPLYLFFSIRGVPTPADTMRGSRPFSAAIGSLIFFCGGAVIFSALGMYAQHVQGRYLPMMDGLKILIDSLSILDTSGSLYRNKKKTPSENASRENQRGFLSGISVSLSVSYAGNGLASAGGNFADRPSSAVPSGCRIHASFCSVFSHREGMGSGKAVLPEAGRRENRRCELGRLRRGQSAGDLREKSSIL